MTVGQVPGEGMVQAMTLIEQVERIIERRKYGTEVLAHDLMVVIRAHDRTMIEGLCKPELDASIIKLSGDRAIQFRLGWNAALDAVLKEISKP